jgi:TRAP-type C4-dicarboxylate transport system permease small subunit
MKKENVIDKIVIFFSNTILVIMVISVILQVVSRTFMRTPFIWTEELARVAYIWLTFIGSATLIKNYEHITVDLLLRKLSSAKATILQIVIDSLSLAFLIFVILGGIKMVYTTNTVILPSIRSLTVSDFYLSLTIGSIISCYYLLQNIICNIIFLHKRRHNK